MMGGDLVWLLLEFLLVGFFVEGVDRLMYILGEFLCYVIGRC